LRSNVLRIVSALTGALLLAGCGLFQTREPEPPVGTNGINPPAASPDMVLQNFVSAVQQKDLQDYQKLFSDTVTGTKAFVFVPTADASIRYNSVFARWSKSAESQYYQNVIASLPSTTFPSLAFLNPTIVRFQADSAIISTEYLLIVPHRLTTVTTTFTGRADFYTAPDRNQSWTIYRWVDFTTKRDSSWSDCKGAFAQ
jgi:hypothetical protein